MTILSENTILYSHKLDSFKNSMHLISKTSAEEAFSDDNCDMFSLYMAYLSYFGKDAMSYENEAIDIAMSGYSKYNSERIQAVSSILENESYYTDISAFGLAIEAVNRLDISASSVQEYDADQIILTMIVIAGIDGSLTIPLKTSVIKFIKACLDIEGWICPPLQLMFQNIEDYYSDETIDEVKLKFGKINPSQMYNLESLSSFGISRRADLQNYLIKEQEAIIYVKDNVSEIFDMWAHMISAR